MKSLILQLRLNLRLYERLGRALALRFKSTKTNSFHHIYNCTGNIENIHKQILGCKLYRFPHTFKRYFLYLNTWINL